MGKFDRFLKPVPKKQSKQQPPRSKEAIQSEHNTLAQAAGELQYQILHKKSQLQQINQRLNEVYAEANAREAIDSKLAQEEAEDAKA